MEEAGGQVIAPIANYQNLVGRFCDSYPSSKKRGVSVHSPNASYPKGSEAWNANGWDWDSARFVAKPLQSSEVTDPSNQRILLRNEDQNRNSNPPNISPVKEPFLKLGSGDGCAKSGTSGETDSEELHPASKPAKRVRSGSPGSANYPVCQVDGCIENLSTAKDYHRRHKVCEFHSKAAESLVSKQTQRFCQQCSRFHLLTEFDAGKRSCRRRLAGHNRRRRKTHSEDINPQLQVPQNIDKNFSDVDIANILAVLSQAQRKNNGLSESFPNRDQLVQIIGNMSSSLPEKLAPKLKGSVPNHVSTGNQNPFEKEITSPPLTKDLLAVLTATSPSPRTHDVQSDQTSTEGSESEKSKSSCVNEATHVNFHGGITKEFPFVGGQRNSTTSSSPMRDVELNVIETSPNLPLQLFSTTSDDLLSLKAKSDWNMLSFHRNNPLECGLPFSSEPIVHDFFGMQSSSEKLKDSDSPNGEVEIPSGHGNLSNLCGTSLQLFGGTIRPGENGSVQSSLDQTEQASTSGSHYSTSTLKSGSQDRTGHIIFKLFDKDPSHLPGSLRTQIHNWLSNSPSDMESYIRPGCIVLSLYLSMSPIEWDKFEENLLSYLKSLVDDIDAQFWGSGRFLVHTNKQIAASSEGKIRLCKSWRTQSTPDLISISPLAVVSGHETSLLLKGRTLLSSGTKIYCTNAVGYCIRNQTFSCQKSMYDEIIMDSFKVDATAPKFFGRCFIEVKVGSRYTSFPIIIANKAICEELKLLEPEINSTLDDIPTCLDRDEGRFDSREASLHFLNELGWLFQRKHHSSLLSVLPDYSLTRLKFLLIFSVERDFCALVKTLLEILVEMNLHQEGLVSDSMEMLSEIHLLNRAVKRMCQHMVIMLTHFSIIDPSNNSTRYIFRSDIGGPCGVTPLHLAASMSDSDSIVDALTSDPLQIGIKSWHSVLDEVGLSPYTYASMRNNHSYNSLVAQKLTDRRNNQVSISINTKCCSKCSLVASLGYNSKIRGSRTFLNRSYVHSILVVAAVCVCVCLILRGLPFVGCDSPFAWENLDYGVF